MSSINGLGGSVQAYGLLQRPGTYEINAKEYGPVLATAMAGAQVVEETASLVVSLSERGYQEMAHALDSAANASVHAYESVKSGVEHVAESIVDGVESAGEAVADFAGDVVDGIGNAASSICEYTAEGVRTVCNAIDLMA